MSAPSIHPAAFVGDGVDLGAAVVIGPGAVVLGPATIGDGVWIGPGAAIGGPPEITTLRRNAAWAGDLDHCGVVIGPGAVIRENAVIHQGSHRATTIGARASILSRAYVAHDVVIGDDAVVSAGVSIGGHVRIGANANIGLNTSIHQRRIVGAGSMIGMGSAVTRDVPPYGKAYGVPVRLEGVNAHLLERLGIPGDVVAELRRRYAGGDMLPEIGGDDDPLARLREELDDWREHATRPVAAIPGEEASHG